MSTLLLSLGGAAYPNAARLRHDAFAASSRAIVAILTTGHQPLVRHDNHLDLLDDPRSWPDQLMTMRQWLRGKIAVDESSEPGVRVDNVLVHYVGHGMLKPNSEEHYLSINATDADDRAMTSASLAQLNEILTKNAARQRRIYLLDACFAAASLRDIMSAGRDALEEKVGAIIAPWPESGRGDRGVAALCSADRTSTASAGGERQLTQFTDGLLSVLETGDAALGEAISLRQTHQLLRTVLRGRYGDDAVKPILVAPDDRDGGIAAVPIFPNVAEHIGMLARTALPLAAAANESDLPPSAGRSGGAASADGDVHAPVSARPAGTTDGSTSTGEDAEAFDWSPATADAFSSGMEGALTPDQRFRQVTYRFFRLPHSTKDAIARKINVGDATDAALPDLDRYKAMLARTRDANRVDRLESMISKAEGQ
ncbi:hypothetical protein MMSR116_23735 [Methylobacterium mesophilicum SR1.6/6]|uniref:GTPase-associated adaptor domain-containing protein n=1 Tax=Methylobacterium mesophilicum SR1.6/6 TaxID=908290 RepID=A0A6B9FPM3_9HYPH|nr:caspase family protein [Methylobacterium mesophilicum]QGY04583.1 hypothetical protein MMSR116_23735 [Methylobacterium mesophilicum SR1.6/6]